ncbi:type II secretion system protein GspD [Zoogloea oleivorans]|uniref:Type II secretion system protein GspD n=2 Tax=Zoogloea oleivorans TaxID=1552750 RepID=A0A6C2D3C9_9RHOO|nr:type II secretion system protein GspD [Zoogloea oleivorans]
MDVGAPVDVYRAEGSVAPATVPDTGPAGSALSAAKTKRSNPVLIKGNDQVVKLPAARNMVAVDETGVALRFEQAPVTEVLHAVLGDLLKLDYAIVPPLSGDITLHTQNPVPRDQLLTIIESLLLNNGIVMVPDVNGRYRIGKADVMKSAVPILRRADSGAAGYGSVIIPLQNIGAAEMADILRPVAGPEAFVRVDLLRNLLVLAGSRNQIEGWLEIVSTFDVDLLKGMSVGLFPLEHTSVKEIEAALRSLFASGESAAKGLTAAAGAAGGSATKTDDASAVPAIRLAGPLGGLVRVLGIERLNALLVITPRAHMLDQAKVWIERLDKPMDSDGEAQLYVYPVQNGSAQHLANLLNGLYAPQPTTTSGQSTTGVAPGLVATTQATAGFGTGSSAFGAGGFGSMSAGAGTRAGQGQINPSSVTQVSLGKDIRVVSDNNNNALLIHAPKRDYKRIEAALRQLDITPNQVLIEASIVEVTLTDETKYGLQWYFQGGVGRSGWSGVGVLSNSTTGAIDAAQQGFSYTVTNPLGAVRAVLNAMADKQLVNVISSPSVMVLDNQTASIQVGDQQPIRSSTTLTDGGVSTSSIQYKDTGVLLSVIPSVNAGNLITMQINQSISDVGSVDSATGQRTFLQRMIASKVAVRSGETIVLGGLIRDNKGDGKQGIPLLQDIPVLGALFSTTTLSKTRTELLVMITPKVVRTEQDVREVGAELKSKMYGLKPLLSPKR